MGTLTEGELKTFNFQETLKAVSVQRRERSQNNAVFLISPVNLQLV